MPPKKQAARNSHGRSTKSQGEPRQQVPESTTSKSQTAVVSLKLKLNLTGGLKAGSDASVHSLASQYPRLSTMPNGSLSVETRNDPNSELKLRSVQQEPRGYAGAVEKRPKRNIKQRKDPDVAYAHDNDYDPEADSRRKPQILSLLKTETKPGPRLRSKTRKINKGDSPGIVEEDEGPIAEATIIPTFDPRPKKKVFELQIDPKIYQILGSLCSSQKTHIDLPTLRSGNTTGQEEPYTSRSLVHLYILCYDSELWNLCDLVTDTWIRAFHTLRARAERNSHFEFWRPNVALQERKRVALEAAQKGIMGKSEHFDPSPPKYDLEFADPLLSEDVTNFDSSNLNDLYNYTSKDCGARLVWADILALGGDKTGRIVEHATKMGYPLHPELQYNIMQTGLRMVRRKLTLKLEESSEGAWCSRYHEHFRLGLPCYRAMAWQSRAEQSSDEDGPQHQQVNGHVEGQANGNADTDDMLVAQMMAEFD